MSDSDDLPTSHVTIAALRKERTPIKRLITKAETFATNFQAK